MTLQSKVLTLKLEAALALRHASWWEKQIALHGEEKTAAFYTHLGLNHLHTKSAVEWEGLTLSREPKDHEKLCVKGVSEAQDSGKASVSAILLKLRTELISEAVNAIKKLSPASYHKLILAVPDEFRNDLRDQLAKIYRKGRELVVREIAKQTSKASDDSLLSPVAQIHIQHKLIDSLTLEGLGLQANQDDDDDPKLDDLVDLTDIRVANEIQARITSAAARFSLLGLTGSDLWGAVEKEVGDGSTGWLERIATGAANKVLNVGRGDEMRDRADDIDRYEQSELLDQNTCGPCAEDDGKTASDPDELPGAPNPDCEGQDLCRGFVVAISV